MELNIAQLSLKGEMQVWFLCHWFEKGHRSARYFEFTLSGVLFTVVELSS